MISGKKSRKACKTGVIHVISIFTELPCSSDSSASFSFLTELMKLKNRSIYNHENWHVQVSFSERETCNYNIFVNPFTSCITDHYQSQLYIILYIIFIVNYSISITEAPTNMEFGIYSTAHAELKRASKKTNSRVSSARHASSRARGLEWSSSARDRAVEHSSARARVVERSSARGRGLYRARRRRAESGSLRHAVITVHIELPVLDSHVAPIIIQRNYRYIQASKHAIRLL